MLTTLLLAATPFPPVSMSSAQIRHLGMDPARLSALDRRLRDASEKGEVAGTVTLVVKRGKVVFHQAHGYADVEARKPMAPDTVFQVMSMTKPFVGVAVVQCAEAGLLNLDDPVSKYLPRLGAAEVRANEGTVKPNRPITLRHLLTHTSGLSGDDPGGLDDDQKRRLTLAKYADLIGDRPLLTQPGTEIRYSGVGINALARVVEMVSGLRFEEYCQRHIFEPCGMKETWFFLPATERARLAKVYQRGDDGRLKEFVHDRFREGAVLANGAGGLYSTASDMARFLAKFSQEGGGLVSPAGFRAMTTVQTGDLLSDGTDERGYGLVFSVVRRPAGSTSLRRAGSYGHSGAFCTDFWVDPPTGTVAVFMSQGLGVGDDLRKSFATMVNAANQE